MNFFPSEDPQNKNNPLDLSIIKTTLTKHNYTFLQPIGKGGFSSIFLIYSNQYNLEFVVKVSNNYNKSNKYDLNEINNLINLNHPNIINMYKYFTDDHYLYIVLEYCEGGSLMDLINQKGRIHPPLLFNYCYQILTALKHCHDLQIAHGDIKPANILIDKNKRLKLADFGLSKGYSPNLIQTAISDSNKDDTDDEVLIGKKGEILTKHFGGSKPYMSPELFQTVAYDPFKSDIWSLGVTFYQLSTGRLPWNTNDMKQLRIFISVGVISFQNIRLPSAFCNVVHRMTEVNPMKRPSLDWLLEQEIFKESVNINHTSYIKSTSIGSHLNSLTSFSNIMKFTNGSLRLGSKMKNKSSVFFNIGGKCTSTFSSDINDNFTYSDSNNENANNSTSKRINEVSNDASIDDA